MAGSGAEVGTAYVAIMPSTSRFGPSLNNQTGSAADSAGRVAGGKFGSAFGLIAGGLAGAGIAGILKDSYQGIAEDIKLTKLTAQVIKTTGGAAKITTAQVQDLADAIEAKTGVDGAAIQASENMLLTFTNVRNEAGKGNDVFNQATQIVQDMSVALGQDGKAGAIQLGKALNDPIKGVSALSKVGVSFTQQQKDQIKVFVDSGNTLAAQKVILSELGKEFGGAAAAQVTGADKVRVAWGKFEDIIGNILVPIVGVLADGMETVLKIGTEWFDSLSSASISPAIKELGAWFQDTLLPILKDVALFVGGTLIDAWHFLSDVFTRFVLPVIKAAGKVIGQLWTAAQPVFRSLGAAFLTVKTFVQQHLMEAFKNIHDIVLNHVVPAFKSFGLAVINTVKWIIKTFGPAAKWLLARLGDMLHFLQITLVPVFKWVFDFIKHNANWLVPILTGIGAAIAAWKLLRIVMALNPFVRIIIILIAVGTFIHSHWEKIKQMFATAWRQITTALHVAWTAIYNFFKTIITAIVNAFHNSINWLVAAGRNIFTGFMNGVHWVWNNILFPFFVGIPRAIIRWFASAGRWLWGAGKAVIQGLVDGVKWVWNNIIVGFFVSVPKWIGGWFVTAGRWLFQAGRAILTGLWDGIKDVFSAVVAWFARLPGRIVDFFVNAAKWLISAGGALIQGLVQGMIDALASPLKVLGPVGDAFISGLKKVFGINSPAKSMIPIGRALAQGMFKGLVAENPEKFAVKIFGSLPNTIKGMFKAGKFSADDLLSIKNPKYASIISSLLGGAGLGGAALGGAFTGGYTGGGSLAAWLTRAIEITGVPMSWLAPLESLAMHESGGNPNAINNYDINAQRGDPSRGLLQTIMSTFQAYRDPRLPNNIYDPVANAVAAINYMKARYGSIFQIASYTPTGFVGGYAEGTNYVPRTGLALVHQGEAIIPERYNQAAAGGSVPGWGGGIDYDRLGAALVRAMNGVSVALDGQAVGRVQGAQAARYGRR